MADVIGLERPVGHGGGLLGAQARAQYAALVKLRWEIFVSGVRSIRGILELGATGIQLMVFSFMGLGVGLALAIGCYSIASRGMWLYLPVVFWSVCLLWQTVPIALASFQEQFDLAGLLRFPVSFGAFFVLNVLFGLVDASSVLGGLCCLGIWIGISLVRVDLAPWLALGLAMFAAFNVLLSRAVLAWINRWLAQRRTREIATAAFLLMLVALQLLNPGLRRDRSERAPVPLNQKQLAQRRQHAEEWMQGLRAMSRVQAWLPPGLAAEVTTDAAEGREVGAAAALGGIALYALAVAGLLGVRLRAEFRGESLGEAPKAKKAEKAERSWLPGGSGPVAAVMEKEMQTLMRATPQLYSIAIPVVMVFVIGTLFRNGGTTGHAFQLALPVCVAYGLLGFTRVIYNNLGMEGAGIQLLFLTPTPVRTVMLGKNLFHGVLYLLMAVASGLVAVTRVGHPALAVTLATAAWLLFALPANLAIGNVLSITMPYKVNPGKLSREPGSQANALLGMLCQTTMLGLGGAVFGLCLLYDAPGWVAPVVLLALAGVATFGWLRVLGNCDEMANRNRDALMATLGKVQ
ncbi:MAG TPA: hypothetical protein VMV57_11325 [Terracidiphilus sp.]|nr:hypothetical protein [Terracidiphilus sp.]